MDKATKDFISYASAISMEAEEEETEAEEFRAAEGSTHGSERCGLGRLVEGRPSTRGGIFHLAPAGKLPADMKLLTA